MSTISAIAATHLKIADSDGCCISTKLMRENDDWTSETTATRRYVYHFCRSINKFVLDAASRERGENRKIEIELQIDFANVTDKITDELLLLELSALSMDLLLTFPKHVNSSVKRRNDSVQGQNSIEIPSHDFSLEGASERFALGELASFHH